MKNSDNGMVLISILLLTVLLTMLTVSMVFISTNHLQMMGNIEQKMIALKAAEAAAEYAMTRLNIPDRPWAVWDPNHETPSTSDDSPDPNANITLRLKGATAYINFTGSQYLSYNNLKGQNPVNRSIIGETKLSGTIPAYSAELICIGKAGPENGDGPIKYVKVIFIRNDIYPYPINSDGQIDFESAGDIKIFGNNSTAPGYIHSNWDGDTEDINNPNYYSIKSELGSGNVDMLGGVASAVGPIKLNRAQEKDVVVAMNPDGREEFEDIDIDNVLKNAKDTGPKEVEPGTFIVTPRYYIKEGIKNEQGQDFNLISAAVKGFESKGGSLSPEQHIPGLLSKLKGCNEPGFPPDVEELKQTTYKPEDGWTVNFTAKSTQDWITVMEAHGENEFKDSKGKVLGWDRAVATKYWIGVDWKLTASRQEQYQDPNTGEWKEKTVTETQQNTWSHLGPMSEIGDVSFTLDATNNWGNKPPPEEVINSCGYVFGLAKLNSNGDLTKFVQEGQCNGELGLDLKVNQEGDTLLCDLNLVKDIYVCKDETSKPAPEDYKIPLKYLAYNPEDPSYKNPQPNVFCISGEQFSVLYGEPPKSLNEIYQNSLIEQTNVSPKLTLHLNEHSIYSDSHVAIGAEVEGKGTLVSRGKMGYIYGMQSNEAIALSGDDLILSTNNQSNIDVRGVLYSDDDTWLIPLNNDSPLATQGNVMEYKLGKEYSDGSDKIIFSYNPSPPVNPAPTTINIASVKTQDGVKYSVNNVGIEYNGTDYDFSNYKLDIECDMTSSPFTYSAKLYEYDKTSKTWKKVNPLPPEYSQPTLDNIGRVIGANFTVGKGDINITGNLVGLNNNSIYPDDDGGNKSIHTQGKGKIFFYYDMISVGKLAMLRGDKFNVRRACWCELN